MEVAMNPDNVYAYLKLLIEAGGIYYVDTDHTIKYRSNNEPVGVAPNSGSKAAKKAIALYKENMEIDSSKVLLNPFSEYVGYHPERDVFYNYIMGMPGCLIKLMILGIADMATDEKKDADFKTASALSQFIGRIDNKFRKEVEKIRACDICCILYSKEKHVAQLISALWESEFEDKNKSKLRKSSLMLIRDIVSTILEVELPEDISHKATVIGCPQFDAVVHVLMAVLGKIQPIVEKVLPVELHVAELNQHLEHLEAYQKAMQWLTTSTASPVKEASNGQTTIAEVTKSPWESTATGVGGVPVIANPTYTPAAQTGVIANPTPTPGPTPVSPVPVTAAAPVAATPVMGGRPVVPSFTMPTFSTPTPVTGYGTMPMMGGGFGMPMPVTAPNPMAMMQMRAAMGAPSPFATSMVTGLPGGY